MIMNKKWIKKEYNLEDLRKIPIKLYDYAYNVTWKSIDKSRDTCIINMLFVDNIQLYLQSAMDKNVCGHFFWLQKNNLA